MEAQTLASKQQTIARPFRTAAVLGAGVMGAQIAAHLANAGLQVHLLDIAPETGPKNAIVEGAFKKMKKLRPNPFFTADAAKRITLGNFDEHMDRLADVDWVLEAVIEKLPIKQAVMAKIEAAVGPNTIITTNTSGLPIHQIADGRSADFRSRFLGTHFFNPPRYLHLFEIIPTPDTDPDIVARLQWFARMHLGKGVVIAKDTPNFIGNRIGVYSMQKAMMAMVEGGYSIKEVDAMTGTLIGRPKSATFRTADVVGLDTMMYVTQNLYDAVPDDESREDFQVPPLLKQLVEQGALGQKTRAGFYKKEGKTILALNPETGAYEEPAPVDLGLDRIKRAGGVAARCKALYEDEGRAGAFFRQTLHDVLGYSCRRLPEIADSPADIDRAVCWGFGWTLGPFQTWDAIGYETVLADLKTNGIALPDWVDAMYAEGATAFYREGTGGTDVYVPGQGYVFEPHAADEIKLNILKKDGAKTVWENPEAALLDLGDGVALYEFRSKANSLGVEVINGIFEAVDIVENGDWGGLVIGNDGANFSVGANLGEMAMAAMMGQFDTIGDMIARFQEAVQRVHYAYKPVVVATQGKVLGGGCEFTMASATPVAAAETYIGLVELGVGLIPAGTGTMQMAAWAADQANEKFPSQVQPFVRKAFENIAMAKVATSAPEAIEMGILPRHTRVVMNQNRRLYVAKEEVLRLANQGYVAPPERTAIYVLGTAGRAQFEAALYQFEQGRFISAYDRYLASRLAYILTGGNLTGPADVHEDYLLELEREVFLSLLGEEKTQARIQSILTTNKPLRN